MIITLRARTCSPKRQLEKISSSDYVAYLKSEPINNKANIELINLLAKHFNVPVRDIKSGIKSKEKIIKK